MVDLDLKAIQVSQMVDLELKVQQMLQDCHVIDLEYIAILGLLNGRPRFEVSSRSSTWQTRPQRTLGLDLDPEAFVLL